MREHFYRYSFLLLSVFLFHSPVLFAAIEADSYESSDDSIHVSAEFVTRGERLFYGLVYHGEKSVNCAGCHNVRFNLSDTVNWNPDAYEISLKYRENKPEDLQDVLINPRAAKLSEAHADIDLSIEDITMIKSYMDVVAEEGLIMPKPMVNRLIFFILLIILLLFSLTDLIITRKIPAKWIHLIIILGSGFFITKILVEEAIDIGRSENYAPNQPLKFSHAIHAGQNKTDCFYCHPSAEYSKSAGIASSGTCMNCHLIVRSGSRSGTWEINKLISSYNEDEHIEWIKVHHNPDHVYFNHAQHVVIGGVECQECHGEVEEMHRIEQVSDLSMGWCIECHRENEVSFHSNEFYSSYEELVQEVKQDEVNAVTVEKVGGTECMKCHY